MSRAKQAALQLLPFVAPFVLLGLVAIALFIKSPLPAIPIVAFLWLLVVKEKGYLIYGGPVFIATGILFAIYPVFWAGFLMVASLILLSCVPARRKDVDRWHIASKDGSLKAWLTPRGPREDIGAIVGDASIHIVAIAGAVVAYATWVA